MLQLSHSGCSCLLYRTFIGTINASTDHKRQISNVAGNSGYNFSAFFEANPWLALEALIGSYLTFLHLCSSTSHVPPPFFVNSSFPPGHSVLFLQLYLLSLPHLLYSFPATRTQSSSVLPTQQGCIHPQQPTLTAVNSNTNLSPSRLKIFPQDGFSTANCEFWLLVKARFAEKQSY